MPLHKGLQQSKVYANFYNSLSDTGGLQALYMRDSFVGVMEVISGMFLICEQSQQSKFKENCFLSNTCSRNCIHYYSIFPLVKKYI